MKGKLSGERSVLISEGKKRTIKDNVVAQLFILPSATILSIFIFIPMGYAFWVSLHRWNLLRPMRFVGLGNYEKLLASADFWHSLQVTVLYTLGTVPTTLVLALFLAIVLNRGGRSVGFYRTGVFIPVVTSLTAAGVVWRLLFEPEFGLVNFLIGLMGLSPVRWLYDPDWALVALMIVGVWKDLGFCIVIFLAGLKNIPGVYYEAAEIDGAGAIYKFKNITVPLLSPTTFFLTIFQFISAFQVFTSAYIMTNPKGGPAGSTEVFTLYLFQNGFKYLKMGYASAIAYVLFGIMFIVTLLRFRLSEWRVHYQ